MRVLVLSIIALALVVMVAVGLTRVERRDHGRRGRDRLAVAPMASAVRICTHWLALTARKIGA